MPRGRRQAGNVFEGLQASIEEAIEGSLEALGAAYADQMKATLQNEGHVDQGRLRDSITWATARKLDHAKVGSSAKETDVIPKPTEKGILFVGTNAPYARYVEKGTGRHKANADQKEIFERNILNWAIRHGFTKKDGSPLETVDDIYWLITKIRKRGTMKHPFVQPLVDNVEASGSAKQALKIAIQAALNKFMLNMQADVVEVKVEM